MNEYCKDGFYSEHGEDRWIAENIALPDFGVYVDVGCAHPYYSNNTQFLRERKWDGLGIDGLARWRDAWWTPFFCAVVGPAGEAGFVNHDLQSRISSGGMARRVVPLELILEGFCIEGIDLMSIDLEGAEFDAFLTMDLEKHLPKIVVAEYSTIGAGDDFRLRDHLLARGYSLAHTTPSNFILTR